MDVGAHGRMRGERGAALVELAILLPVVIMLVFGMIEFSSAYQASSTASASARAGARVASAEPRRSSYAVDAATAAATALHTIPSTEPIEMWVYKANGAGYPESGNFTTCTTNCIKYNWLPATRTFDTANPSGGGWSYATQNACTPATWDNVGVYVKMSHKFITRLFGASVTVSDHAVFRLEPAETTLCP